MTDIYEFLRKSWYVQYILNCGNLLLNISVANFLRTLRVPLQTYLTL